MDQKNEQEDMEMKKKELHDETIVAETPYNAVVKARLDDWRKKFETHNNVRLNYAAIAEKMKKMGIHTSAQKIGAMFDPEKPEREVKLRELVALCKMFRIPMMEICDFSDFPDHIDVAELVRGDGTKGEEIAQFTDKFYIGDYFCYTFEAKHYEDRIYPVQKSNLEESRLNISIEQGETIVTLSEMKATTSFYGKAMPSFVLKGKLYHLKNTDMAYSFVSDPTGRRSAALFFSYLNLSDDVRYYMTVAKLGISTNQTHMPIFQKMAVFRERQNVYTNAEEADIVRGILALNTAPIILDEETIEELIREDEDFQRLLSTDRALKKCYAFSEMALRCEAFFIEDEYEKMKKMLKLRKNSMLAGYEVVYEPNNFADFIREYQKNQMNKMS